MDEASIERLLQFCDTLLDTIIVELLSQTGLQVTEACQLQLDDLVGQGLSCRHAG